MNRPAIVVGIVEDVNQQTLLWKHLRKRGYAPRQIRIEYKRPNYSAPDETGGLTRLYQDYAKEVEGLRAILARRSGVLIVVADADNLTVAERIATLDAKLSDAEKPARQNDEPIFFVIPRRNVETWIHYLAGNNVDEETDYKPRCSPSEIAEAPARFANMSWPRQTLPTDSPPSLVSACDELWRIP